MRLEEYLRENKVAFTTHEHEPAYTAQQMAAQEHVSGKITAKAVIVKAGEQYVMCVLPAPSKLDLKKAAKVVGAKKARLADENEMAGLFPDVDVGAEPPFGNLYELQTVVDERLIDKPEIVFQSGTHRQAIRMKYADYERLVQPTRADLAVSL